MVDHALATDDQPRQIGQQVHRSMLDRDDTTVLDADERAALCPVLSPFAPGFAGRVNARRVNIRPRWRTVQCGALSVTRRTCQNDVNGRPGVTDASGAAPVVSSSMNAAVEFSIALNIHPTSSHW